MTDSALVPRGNVYVAYSGSFNTPDLVAAWLVSFKGHTRAAYARDLGDFQAWLGRLGLDLVVVRRPHLDLYARDLDEGRGLAPATIARRLAALSSFYGYLVDEQLLERSPVERVRRPKVSAESPTLGLTRDELARLLTRAGLDGPRAHALVCLLALNGLRISEALGIDVDDLGEERGHQVARIRRKGGKVQLVPLAPRVAAAVAELVSSDPVTGGRSLNTSRPLFPAAGGRLDRHAAYLLVKRLVAEAGIRKRISPHSLRHTFATLALDAGVQLLELQVAMGHADPRTTQRYDRARRELDNAPTYRLGEFLEP